MSKKICIFGASLDTGNMGVTALSKSLIHLFSVYSDDYEIVIFQSQRGEGEFRDILLSDDKSITIEILPYFNRIVKPFRYCMPLIFLFAILYKFLPFLRRYIMEKVPMINRLVNSIFVGDIHGGDSFSDIYGYKYLLNGSIPIIVCRLLHIDYIMLPQKYGPFQNKKSRRFAKFILKKSKINYCRDEKSVDIVNELLTNCHRNDIRLCTDVAFHLPKIKPKEIRFKGSIGNDILKNDFIGINISGLLWIGGYSGNNMFNLKEDYKELMRRVINNINETLDIPILLIPHTIPLVESKKSESDMLASLELMDSIDKKGKLVLLEGLYDASELKWIISQCGFFIGSRMHSCIAALSEKIPSLGFAYSDKFTGVFNTIGLKDNVIDLRENNIDNTIQKFIERFQEKEDVKEALNSRIPEVKELSAKEVKHWISDNSK